MATLTDKEKLNIFQNLSVTLSSGIPILEALDIIYKDSTKSQKKVLLTIREFVSKGKTVSDALTTFKKDFDKVVINLIKVSEEAGSLEKTLKDIVKTYKRDLEFNGKIKSALVYPAVVLALFSSVLLLMLTYVIPRVSGVFLKLNMEIPKYTLIMFEVSRLFNLYIFQITIFAVFSIIFLVILYNTKKLFFKNIMANLPFIEKIFKKRDLANFTRSLSLVLESGIPLVEGLDYTANTVSSKKIALSISKASKLIQQGKSFHESLEISKKIFPPTMLKLIESGEASGSLQYAISEISLQLEEEVSEEIKTLTTLMEPAILIVVGLLVGGMMLSIISPIYNLIGNIRAR